MFLLLLVVLHRKVDFRDNYSQFREIERVRFVWKKQMVPTVVVSALSDLQKTHFDCLVEVSPLQARSS